MSALVRTVLALASLVLASTAPARAQVPYDSCGTLVPGVTCPVIFQDTNSVTWLLSNTGGFVVGDVVHVTGQADPGCITFCQQGGCISVATISPCVTSVGTPFCFGDGTGTPCPCANSGGVGLGCANSTGAGASLAATGTASVSADTVALSGGGMPNGPALYFQGTTTVAGGLGTAFGDGLRCAGGTIVRLGITTNVSGSSTFPTGGSSLSAIGGVTAGDVRRYQIWYRDSAAFCTAATFDLTNGLELTWGA